MKKFLVLFLMVIACKLYSQEKEVGKVALLMPNLEGTFLYEPADISAGIKAGMTSKFLCIANTFDLRAGIMESETGLLALGVNLSALEKLGEKLGIKIDYIWKGKLNVSGGLWSGWNFKDKNWHWGLLAVMIELKF